VDGLIQGRADTERSAGRHQQYVAVGRLFGDELGSHQRPGTRLGCRRSPAASDSRPVFRQWFAPADRSARRADTVRPGAPVDRDSSTAPSPRSLHTSPARPAHTAKEPALRCFIIDSLSAKETRRRYGSALRRVKGKPRAPANELPVGENETFHLTSSVQGVGARSRYTRRVRLFAAQVMTSVALLRMPELSLRWFAGLAAQPVSVAQARHRVGARQYRGPTPVHACAGIRHRQLHS